MRARERIAIACVAAAVVACKKQERPQVAFLLSTMQQDRYQKDVRFFESRATELGLSVITLAADDDATKQSAQVEAMLAKGVKVLVVQPTDSEAAATYVHLAHEAGAKIIAYDRAIVAPDVDYYVSHDSYRVGVLQAQAALAATHNKGKYVILAGPSGHSVATEITRGYKDTLAPYIARGEVELVLERTHATWSAELARQSVQDALARGHVDAILANNSSMARGAVEAVSAAALDHVFIAGADADAANVNLICQGKQTIEVLKNIPLLARTAAETARKLYDGEAPAPIAAVRVDVVTRDNVKPLLVDSGFLTANELPACNRLAAVR